MLVANLRGRSRYEDAISATWRLGQSGDLPLSSSRRELVRYACLAANSHNTQPWQFRISERSILVLPDAGRRLLAVDPDDHHLFASLGCAVEILWKRRAPSGPGRIRLTNPRRVESGLI